MAADRVRYLDGIRAVAILMVLQQHWVKTPTWLAGGYLGVDIFFVLSGFIITTLLARSTGGYTDFVRRRVRRLYPPLLVALAGGALMCLLPFSPIPATRAWISAGIAALQGSSFVQAGGWWEMMPFGVTWSLAVEWYFYLLWPVVVLLWRRRHADPYRCGAWTATIGIALYAMSLPLGPGWFYYGPLARFAELLAGSALAYWSLARADRVLRVSPWVGWTALVALGGWALAGPSYLTLWYRAVGLPLAVSAALTLILVGRARPTATITRLLGSRPVAGLGVVSYSLYLWHTIPAALVTRQSMPGMSDHQRLGLIVATTALFTTLTYVVVEKRVMRSRPRALQVPASRGLQEVTAAAPTATNG